MTLYALTGDLQFADQARLSHMTEDGITSRLRDQIECFLWIVDEAVAQECSALIALGDVFDQRNAVTSTVLDRVGRAFEYAAEQFEDDNHILVGNHDTPMRTPHITSLRCLAGYAHVWDAPGAWDELAFAPWMHDPDDYRKAIGELSDFEETRFLFSHVMVEGAVPAHVGKARKDLRPSRWERIFLGDIHEPLSFEADRIQYVGAPMHHHFGDAGGERGFWILDTESGEFEFIENVKSPRFHIVTDPRQFKEVREGDFVRVQVEDDEAAGALEREAAKTTTNVESRAVVLDDPDPRLDVRAEQKHEDILRRYVEHCEMTEADHLVEVGLEILEEVGA